MTPVKTNRAVVGIALLAGLWNPAPARADTDSQSWMLFTAMGRFAPRVRWYAEFQPRFSVVDHEAVERVLVRGAVGWQASRQWSIWQGVAETPLQRPSQRGEVRWFQQFLYEDKVGDLRVTGRTRLEQRDIAGTPDQSHRFRTLWRLAKPLAPNGPLQAVVYDEVFWNLNTVASGPSAGFDRNRTFIGASRRIGPGVRVEAGWLREDSVRRGAPGRRIDALVTQLHFDF